MIVNLIAATQFEDAWGIPGYIPHFDIGGPEEMFEEVPDDDPSVIKLGEKLYRFTEEYEAWSAQLPKGSDELAEAAGRLCYKSFARPNPATAKTHGYVANIIAMQHFSVLEHASATFYVGEVSRSLLAELTRHRHLSFSVVSQRYVNHSNLYDNNNFRYPPIFDELDASQQYELKKVLDGVVLVADQGYEMIAEILEAAGVPRKQVREAARSVLPQATHTEFVVTGNLRTWREVLQKRLSPGADAEIRQLAQRLLYELKKYAPSTFQDFEEE